MPPGQAMPSSYSSPAALSRSRQAKEMSAMVSALTRVVAGSAPPPAAAAAAKSSPASAEEEEAWWPLYEELDHAPPASAFVRDGKRDQERTHSALDATCMYESFRFFFLHISALVRLRFC